MKSPEKPSTVFYWEAKQKKNATQLFPKFPKDCIRTNFFTPFETVDTIIP